MALLDFPSNPSPGQEYPFAPFVYVWDGEKWKTIKTGDNSDDALRTELASDIGAGMVGTTTGQTVQEVLDQLLSKTGSTIYVQEFAPTDADPGSLWYSTTDGQIYILYEDVDSTQWVNASPESDGGGSSEGEYVPITGGTINGTLAINNGVGTVGQQFKTVGNEVLTQHLNDNGFAMSGWVTNKTSYVINHFVYNPESGGVKYFYLSYDPTGDTTAIRNPITIQAQGTQSGSLTRKDWVDSQLATKAATSHTHTAAQSNSDLIAGSYGQVGTHLLLIITDTAAIPGAPGTVYAGSQLRWASAGGDHSVGNPAPSGSWKSLSYLVGGTGIGTEKATGIFVRIL